MTDEPRDLVFDVLKQLQASIVDVKSGLEAVRRDVQAIRGDVDELKVRAIRIEGRVELLATDVAAVRHLMTGFWESENAQEARLARLERRMDALEARQKEH